MLLDSYHATLHITDIGRGDGRRAEGATTTMKLYAYTFKTSGQIVACGTSVSAARKDLASVARKVGGINATQCDQMWINADVKRVGDVTGDTEYTPCEAPTPTRRELADMAAADTREIDARAAAKLAARDAEDLAAD